jgi:hypothetical protein
MQNIGGSQSRRGDKTQLHDAPRLHSAVVFLEKMDLLECKWPELFLPGRARSPVRPNGIT